ncbi:hypothetical protein AO1008_04814 [Aspergillus oryzae 100-8]|uniref:F-box domain-containing protein n=1 Tax=Aspergillus oryzae (strain 3.042) TaxID=1160506 RepID=I7ZPJ5_ASPO3|nr:hypothetical protein Ao3042_10389 [Aspergillus oryzae 3.042]KDE78500.1 hypothetical protein AO1008_04814 [Aspergillus oryzae 100-8]|eukprot:EIT73792.1 hypothetical protein Ao3042_10389 [Aspergillus oryzae 3.042]
MDLPYEILEAILLQTDIRTLLTSATRVCRSWHNIIQGSASLQAVLFLKPVKEPHKRIRNPLIETDIWPELFRKRFRSPSDRSWQVKEEFPCMDPDKEKAYLREEASWRRMLLHQPPTSHLALIEQHSSAPCPVVSQIRFYVDNNDFIRLGHLGKGVDTGYLIPGRDMLLFYDQGGRVTDREPNFLIFGWKSKLRIGISFNLTGRPGPMSLICSC